MNRTVLCKDKITRIDAEILELRHQIRLLNASFSSFNDSIDFQITNSDQMPGRTFSDSNPSKTWKLLYNSESEHPMLTRDGWNKGFKAMNKMIGREFISAINTCKSENREIKAVIFGGTNPYMCLNVNPAKYSTYSFSEYFEYESTDLSAD